jgi:Leishmanolysin.
MTASEIDDARISEFTLALMEATGWYEVDYSMAEPFFWGKGKGCNFIRGKCVETGGTPNFDEFCSPLMEYGCTHSGRSQGFCGTTQIRTGTVSSSMNYWGNNTIVSDSFADNCPYFAAYSNLDCENPAHKKLAELPSAESYGYGSRCFSGSFRETAASSITLTYCFQFQVRIP